MKKTINPSQTPQAWDSEALFNKALRYIERMAEEDSAGWEHALWSSLALEFLSRAALANIHPALLAEQGDRNWHHLFHSLGFTPTEAKFAPRSIAVQEVLKRLGEILPGFDRELENFCILHTGRRNAELHSGETPFDGVHGSTWHPTFYRACAAMLESLGLALKDLVGDDEAKVAEKLIAAATDEAAKAVLGDVEAFRKVWQARSKDEQDKGVAIATVWATRQNGHRVECPSCKCTAIVSGEPIAPPVRSLKNDKITEAQEYLPNRFECVACGLKVAGLSRLNAVGLGARFKKTQIFDAAEYYAPDDPYEGYEDDNNEPF